MSTKAIRKVLRDMQCDYNPCLTGMCRKHEALAEVDAIEQACVFVVRESAITDVENEHVDLIKDIAREAK